MAMTQRLGLDASAVVVVIGALTTAGEGVLLVHVTVDADDYQTLDGLTAVTQGCRVALGLLAIAIVAVQLDKLVAGDGRSHYSFLPVKAACIRVVAVMVAGDNQRLDTLGRHHVEVMNHALMAQPLTIVREVTCNQDQCGLGIDDAVGEGTHDGIALGHHLAVAGVGTVDGTAGRNQSRRQQVGVTDDDDAVAERVRRDVERNHC